MKEEEIIRKHLKTIYVGQDSFPVEVIYEKDIKKIVSELEQQRITPEKKELRDQLIDFAGHVNMKEPIISFSMIDRYLSELSAPEPNDINVAQVKSTPSEPKPRLSDDEIDCDHEHAETKMVRCTVCTDCNEILETDI